MSYTPPEPRLAVVASWVADGEPVHQVRYS